MFLHSFCLELSPWLLKIMNYSLGYIIYGNTEFEKARAIVNFILYDRRATGLTAGTVIEISLGDFPRMIWSLSLQEP